MKRDNRGRPKTRENHSIIKFHFEEELKKKFQEYCSEHEITMQDVLDMLLRRYMNDVQGVGRE